MYSIKYLIILRQYWAILFRIIFISAAAVQSIYRLLYITTLKLKRGIKMNNEELANNIQNGNKELIIVLWEQVEKFIRLKADERAAAINNRDIADDLYQSGYFALLNAVKSFDDSRGMNFLSYLKYHLKTEFDECLGIRTSRTQNEPMHHAISLDIAAYQNEKEIMLKDTIIDPAAAEMFNSVDEADYWDSIRILLLEAINKLNNDNQRKLFNYMLACDTSIIAAANHLNIKHGYHHYRQGIRHLKRYFTKGKGKILKEYDLNFRYYQTGLKHFQNTFTSSVENIAIYELEKWLNDSLNE